MLVCFCMEFIGKDSKKSGIIYLFIYFGGKRREAWKGAGVETLKELRKSNWNVN